MKRKSFTSGTSWESVAGYSRALRYGPWIEVSGTVASLDGKVVEPNSPEGQTRFILERIKGVLEEAGASLEDVVRTRIYVTNIKFWESVARVHGQYFKDIKPATSMVEVSDLIGPEFLVEIEARAYVEGKEI